MSLAEPEAHNVHGGRMNEGERDGGREGGRARLAWRSPPPPEQVEKGDLRDSSSGR